MEQSVNSRLTQNQNLLFRRKPSLKIDLQSIRKRSDEQLLSTSSSISPQTYSEQFQELETIGQGGSSVIKKIKRNKDGKIFACKIMRLHNNDTEYFNKCINEYNVMKLLQDDLCLQVHDYYYEPQKDKFYLIMEYAKGQTLEELVQKKLINTNQHLLIAEQLIKGVIHLNEKGIFHRDINPKNIILNTETNSLKIVDYGSGKILQNQQARDIQTEEFFSPTGTLPFKAPELVKNDSYNVQVDVWGVGVTLLYCILGQNPFDQDIEALTINSIINSQQFMQQLLTKKQYKNNWLLGLIQEMLQTEPTSRPLISEIYRKFTTKLQRQRQYLLNKYSVQQIPQSQQIPFTQQMKQLDEQVKRSQSLPKLKVNQLNIDIKALKYNK